MMKTPTKPSSGTRRRGFVLLYAVMTASIILAVGVSIISIALKQLSIANLGRESQYAFYAANTGAECALYQDFHGVVGSAGVAADGSQYFRRFSVFKNPFILGTNWPEVPLTDTESVVCARTELRANGAAPVGVDGIDKSWVEGTCPGYAADTCDSTSFTVFLGRLDDGSGDIDETGPCARVTVKKQRGTAGTDIDGKPIFTESATGDNLQTTIDSRGYNYCSQNNSRRVERGLKFTY